MPFFPLKDKRPKMKETQHVIPAKPQELIIHWFRPWGRNSLRFLSCRKPQRSADNQWRMDHFESAFSAFKFGPNFWRPFGIWLLSLISFIICPAMYRPGWPIWRWPFPSGISNATPKPESHAFRKQGHTRSFTNQGHNMGLGQLVTAQVLFRFQSPDLCASFVKLSNFLPLAFPSSMSLQQAWHSGQNPLPSPVSTFLKNQNTGFGSQLVL